MRAPLPVSRTIPTARLPPPTALLPLVRQQPAAQETSIRLQASSPGPTVLALITLLAADPAALQRHQPLPAAAIMEFAAAPVGVL